MWFLLLISCIDSTKPIDDSINGIDSSDSIYDSSDSSLDSSDSSSDSSDTGTGPTSGIQLAQSVYYDGELIYDVIASGNDTWTVSLPLMGTGGRVDTWSLSQGPNPTTPYASVTGDADDAIGYDLTMVSEDTICSQTSGVDGAGRLVCWVVGDEGNIDDLVSTSVYGAHSDAYYGFTTPLIDGSMLVHDAYTPGTATHMDTSGGVMSSWDGACNEAAYCQDGVDLENGTVALTAYSTGGVYVHDIETGDLLWSVETISEPSEDNIAKMFIRTSGDDILVGSFGTDDEDESGNYKLLRILARDTGEELWSYPVFAAGVDEVTAVDGSDIQAYTFYADPGDGSGAFLYVSGYVDDELEAEYYSIAALLGVPPRSWDQPYVFLSAFDSEPYMAFGTGGDGYAGVFKFYSLHEDEL